MKISIVKKWSTPEEFFFDIEREQDGMYIPHISIFRKKPSTTSAHMASVETIKDFTERAYREFDTLVENYRKMKELKPETLKEVEI